MRKCERCGRIYCRDCMVPDVVTGDPTRLYCLNCARRTVSRTTRSKYDGLTGYLRFRGSFTNNVKLSFARMDGIIGDNLPMEAYKATAWWSNDSLNLHSKAWLEAGWEVGDVNLKEGYVIFKKVREESIAERRGRARKRKTMTVEGFTPVHVRLPPKRIPSKTKLSKMYARIKNIERKRQYPQAPAGGGFKPKSAYAKRLFKEQKKAG